MSANEMKCSTTCHFHEERTDDIEEIKSTLNGKYGDVGVVGKLNTYVKQQEAIITRLDDLDAKFWKLTLLMLGGLAVAALNLFLLLAKDWGGK